MTEDEKGFLIGLINGIMCEPVKSKNRITNAIQHLLDYIDKILKDKDYQIKEITEARDSIQNTYMTWRWGKYTELFNDNKKLKKDNTDITLKLIEAEQYNYSLLEDFELLRKQCKIVVEENNGLKKENEELKSKNDLKINNTPFSIELMINKRRQELQELLTSGKITLCEYFKLIK